MLAQSPPKPGELRARLAAGIPAILLLASWLVLFNGAQVGGWAFMVTALGFFVLLFQGRSRFFFGFLCGALTSFLMAYQPNTVTGVSQAGIACAWLFLAFFLDATEAPANQNFYCFVSVKRCFFLWWGSNY